MKHLVWVRLEEIPLSLWQRATFEAIENCYGRFISEDEDTKEINRLDYAVILRKCLTNSRLHQSIK